MLFHALNVTKWHHNSWQDSPRSNTKWHPSINEISCMTSYVTWIDQNPPTSWTKRTCFAWNVHLGKAWSLGASLSAGLSRIDQLSYLNHVKIAQAANGRNLLISQSLSLAAYLTSSRKTSKPEIWFLEIIHRLNMLSYLQTALMPNKTTILIKNCHYGWIVK